jgi:hypothetical protein
MKREVLDRWLTALRSGDYAQVDGALLEIRNGKPHGYCCLGVLADLHDPTGWSYTEGTAFASYYCEDISDCSVLPYNLEERLFGEAGGYNSRVMSQAIEMNDNGNTFIEIADYLEANIQITE